jgi:excisionase family DNA binding protein
MPDPTPARFLRLDDVAEELTISHSQAYALVRRRELPAIQVGGRGQWRVKRVKLEEYVARLYEGADAGESYGL